MKWYALFPVAMLSLMLGSCQQSALFLNHSFTVGQKASAASTNIYFFYSAQTTEAEDAYYDALFTLTEEYQEQDLDITFLSIEKNEDMVEHFDVVKGPALIVTRCPNISLRISGTQDSSFIYKKLSAIFEQREDSVIEKRSA